MRCVAELGADAVKLRVPMRVDIKYGRNWADATHKQYTDILAVTVSVSASDNNPAPPPATRFVRYGGPRDASEFPNLNTFVDFVAERWAITRRRLAGELPPWSDNEILRQCRDEGEANEVS
jgi:hypothetical protein